MMIAILMIFLQTFEIDMEEEFLNLGLDIIGLGVFNYNFGSITPGISCYQGNKLDARSAS